VSAGIGKARIVTSAKPAEELRNDKVQLARFVRSRGSHGFHSLSRNSLPRKYGKCTCPSRQPLSDNAGVTINNSGPYNFILDTGTEITMIHPSLAALLHLSTYGPAEVVGAGLHESASLVQLDQIDAGSHALANQEVMVYDFNRLAPPISAFAVSSARISSGTSTC